MGRDPRGQRETLQFESRRYVVGGSARRNAEADGREGGSMIIDYDVAYTILALIIICPMVTALFVWAWDFIRGLICTVCGVIIYLLERKG